MSLESENFNKIFDLRSHGWIVHRLLNALYQVMVLFSFEFWDRLIRCGEV